MSALLIRQVRVLSLFAVLSFLFFVLRVVIVFASATWHESRDFLSPTRTSKQVKLSLTVQTLIIS